VKIIWASFTPLSEHIPPLGNSGAKYALFGKIRLFYIINKMLPVIVATLAPVVNSIQLFPQLYKTYITKSVKDLSFYSLFLVLITNLLWLLHGYFIVDISLIAAGVVNIIINVALLSLYLLYRKSRRYK